MAAIALASFLLLAVISPRVVAWARTVAGAQPGSPAVQAYFPDPIAADRGINVGRPVIFVVLTAKRSNVTWTAASAMRRYRQGRVATRPNRAVQVAIPTHAARAHAWLTIRVAGAAAPLRVWLR